jgi:hypothetical protein
VISGASPRVRVFVYREPVDMRKAYDTRSALVEGPMKKSRLSGDVFAFIGRTRKRAKALYFDGTGRLRQARPIPQVRTLPRPPPLSLATEKPRRRAPKPRARRPRGTPPPSRRRPRLRPLPEPLPLTYYQSRDAAPLLAVAQTEAALCARGSPRPPRGPRCHRRSPAAHRKRIVIPKQIARPPPARTPHPRASGGFGRLLSALASADRLRF